MDEARELDALLPHREHRAERAKELHPAFVRLAVAAGARARLAEHPVVGVLRLAEVDLERERVCEVDRGMQRLEGRQIFRTGGEPGDRAVERLLERERKRCVVERDLLAPGLLQEAVHERARHVVALESAAEPQVQVGLCRGVEHLRQRHGEVGVQLHERNVPIVQRAERRLRFRECRGPDQRKNASLFVAEERADRERKRFEVAIEQPDDGGEVVAELGVAEPRSERVVSLVGFEGAGTSGQLHVSEVEDAEHHSLRLVGDPGADAQLARRDLRGTGLENLQVLALDVVTVDMRARGKGLEERRDGVVRGDAGELDRRGANVPLVDLAGASLPGEVALRGGEPLEKRRFEVDAEAASGELQNASCIAEDLLRLDAADVVKEPAAARVHQHRVALELEELERADALGGAEVAVAELPQESFDTLLPRLEDDVDVVIARPPRVTEELAPVVLETGRDLVAQPVERVAERGAPLLVPAKRRSGAASAVGTPSRDSVRTAPRRVLVDLHFVRRGRQLEELSVVRQLCELVLFDVVERVGERHVALRMMMAVGLAVGRDVDELRPLARRGERAHEAIGQVLALVEQPLECDAARDRSVVEEEGHRSSRRERDAVRHRRIDLCPADVVPDLFPDGPHRLRLVRREDREQDSVLGQQVERVEVDCRLGEPHPLGLPAEAALEVADTPEDLRLLVAPVRQRHDHVVVRLRESGAVAGEALAARDVGREDLRVGFGRLPLEPREERRAEVEADPRVVVLDLHDPAGVVENPRRRVGCVTLRRDPLVPVVVGRRGILKLDLLEPGVLARGLVEMSVNADVSVHWAGRGYCFSFVNSSAARTRTVTPSFVAGT